MARIPLDRLYEISWLRRWELLSHLSHTYKVKKMAEIGAYYGDTAIRVIGPGTWENKPFERFDEYLIVDTVVRPCLLELEKKFSFVKCLNMPSVEAAKLVEDNHFDLIFIDANHLYEHVKADTLAWYPKLKSKGWLVFHDYYLDKAEPQGPTKAVEEIFGDDFLLMYEGAPWGNRCCALKRKP